MLWPWLLKRLASSPSLPTKAWAPRTPTESTLQPQASASLLPYYTLPSFIFSIPSWEPLYTSTAQTHFELWTHRNSYTVVFLLLGKSCLVATLVAHVEVIQPFLSTQFLWTVIPSVNFLPWKATGGQSSAEIMWFLKVPPSTLGRQSYTVGGTVAAADSSLHLGKVYASCPFSLGNNSKSNSFKKKKKKKSASDSQPIPAAQ